jgi:phosphorylcholine metabolism protein LicD
MTESLDSWSCTTSQNIDEKIKRTTKYKKPLLEMANHVHKILSDYKQLNTNFDFFLMDGTLLGASRDGQMIRHDYDFDYGVYLTDKIKLNDLSDFVNTRLNDTYVCKLVNTYALKIEVYEPVHGKHSEHIADDFYNVILDLQLYLDDPNDCTMLKVQYFKDDNINKYNLKKEWFFPTKQIMFENYMYPCPNDPLKVLTEIYGYIGHGAVFDKSTGKYKQKND